MLLDVSKPLQELADSCLGHQSLHCPKYSVICPIIPFFTASETPRSAVRAMADPNASTTAYVYTQIWAFAPPWTLVSESKATVTLAFQKPHSADEAIPTPIDVAVSASDGPIFSWTPFDGQNANTPATDPRDRASGRASTSQDPSASSPDFSASSSENMSITPTSPALPADPEQTTSNSSTGTSPTPPDATTVQSSVPIISQVLPTESSISPDSNQFSIAQLAGLAVGCIAAGILIATIVACLVARKRRRSTATRLSVRSRNMASASDNDLDKKSAGTALKHIERLPSTFNSSTLLDRSLSEGELVSLFKRLREHIAQHVDKCLRDGGWAVTRRPDASLVRQLDGLIGSQSVIGAQKLAEMLLDRQSQSDALRFLLAWCLFESIKSTGAPETTLLPPELSECMASMTGLRNDMKGQYSLPNSVCHTKQLIKAISGRSILLAKWRQTIRLLMEPTYGRLPNISANDPRQVNIREMASKILEILRVFTMAIDDDIKLRDLSDLICEAATFSYTLFTQPSEWHFDWTNARYGNTSELVVFPALLKATDEHGHILPVKELRESITCVKTGR